MSSSSLILFSVLFYLVVGVVFLGWLIPLIVGLSRRKRQAGGTRLIAVGSVWGILAIVLLSAGILAIYRLTSQMHAETFDTSSYKGQTGTISIPWNDTFSLHFRGASTNGGDLVVPGKEGKAIAPAGTFAISMISLNSSTSNDAAFFAFTYFDFNKPLKVSVTANEQTALNLGPPFFASIQINQTGATNVEFNYKLQDAQSNSWRVSNSRTQKSTGFEVRDNAGKVIWKGDFQYG